MIIEGVHYHEKMELETFISKVGVETITSSHKRSIGDRSYTLNQTFVNGESKHREDTFDFTLGEFLVDEIQDFQKNWEENWDCNAKIDERSTDIMKTFFVELLSYGFKL